MSRQKELCGFKVGDRVVQSNLAPRFWTTCAPHSPRVSSMKVRFGAIMSLSNWRIFSARGFVWAAHIGSGPFGTDTIFCRERDGSWGESVYANVAAIKSYEGRYDSLREITIAAEVRAHLSDLARVLQPEKAAFLRARPCHFS